MLFPGKSMLGRNSLHEAPAFSSRFSCSLIQHVVELLPELRSPFLQCQST